MRAAVFLQGLIAFLIVAFGQPSFSPFLGPIAAAVGYALFWRAIRIYPFKKQRFWRACLWYGSVSFIQLSWMSAIEYQGVYILAVWLGLCVWLGVQFGFLSILIPYNQALKFPRILAIASIWTLLEWSRYYVLCGYSWNLSGLALSNPYAMQLAAVFGVLGLSFWVIFANLLGLRAFLRKGIKHYLIWGSAICVPYLFGLGHISYHQGKMGQGKDSLSCLLVQTGLLPSEKVPLEGKVRAFISPYDQWKRILSFVKAEQSRNLDLIVLPEAAVPLSSGTNVYDQKRVEEIFFEVFGPLSRRVFPDRHYPYGEETAYRVSNSFWAQALANTLNSEVIIGLDHVDHEGRAYNSAFHMKPHETSVDRYDKRVLMPLAEYLPFRWLTPLVKIYGITSSFTPGREAHVFKGKVSTSVSICYEETFPEKVREGRKQGAQLLVNITNDGWYPFSRLPSQHYEHAKFRAVENGITLVRACNTGISAVVDSLGRAIGKLEERGKGKKIQAGVLFAELDLYTYPTLFVFWGNWGILSLCLIFLGGFIVFRKEMHW